MLVNLGEDVKMLVELMKTNPNYTMSIESIDDFNPAIPDHMTEQARRESEAEKKSESDAKSGDADRFIGAAYDRGQQDSHNRLDDEER